MAFKRQVTSITARHPRLSFVVCQITAEFEPQTKEWYSEQGITFSTSAEALFDDEIERMNSDIIQSVSYTKETFFLSSSEVKPLDGTGLQKTPSILAMLTKIRPCLHGLGIRAGCTIFLWSDTLDDDLLGFKITENGYKIDVYPSDQFKESVIQHPNQVYILHNAFNS